jgi:hypothetical protein
VCHMCGMCVSDVCGACRVCVGCVEYAWVLRLSRVYESFCNGYCMCEHDPGELVLSESE